MDIVKPRLPLSPISHMTKNFTDCLAILNAHHSLATDHDWENWLRAVEQLPPAQSEIDIASLYALLSDDIDIQDGMWTLLHKIEDNEPTMLMHGFVRAVAAMQNAAPIWAKTCAMRILNNDSDCQILRAAINDLPPHAVQPICELITRIAETEPDFAASAALVLS